MLTRLHALIEATGFTLFGFVVGYLALQIGIALGRWWLA